MNKTPATTEDILDVSVVKSEAADQIISGIHNAANDIFSSFRADDHDGKVRLYNASTGDGQTLKENLNKVLDVVDVVIIPVDVINDDGTITTVPRTTLITKKGEYISATSWGVYNSVRKLMGIFGTLHFDDGLKISPVEVKTKNGFTMNLRLQ